MDAAERQRAGKGRLAASSATIEFLERLGTLRSIDRETLVGRGEAQRRENVAEHSWHAAVTALVLIADANVADVDATRVALLLLAHDLPEIETGDHFAYGHGEDEIAAADRAGAKALFATAPAAAKVLDDLWSEFDYGASREAIVARAIDVIHPILQNYWTGGGSWLRHGISAREVYRRITPIREVDRWLFALAAELIDRSVSMGYLNEC